MGLGLLRPFFDSLTQNLTATVSNTLTLPPLTRDEAYFILSQNVDNLVSEMTERSGVTDKYTQQTNIVALGYILPDGDARQVGDRNCGIRQSTPTFVCVGLGYRGLRRAK